ncbi:hypothetical protein M514_15220 [Trichuris suis]|uniref:Uncharacterized protein n=1 Tax=Trichuris suis TaxID=68888 RepID=A0A085NTM0_9BILA|nr:hypothetical protein M514_15220 [Trichuris suis]
MELDVCTTGIMKENKWIKKMNVMKLLTDEKVLKKREMMKKWYESINEEDLKHSRKNILKNNGKIPEFTLKREQRVRQQGVTKSFCRLTLMTVLHPKTPTFGNSVLFLVVWSRIDPLHK